MCKAVREMVQEGLTEGDEKRLIRQICKKLRKGTDPAQIAVELEEEEATIRLICDVAERFAPEYEEDKIYNALHKDKAA